MLVVLTFNVDDEEVAEIQKQDMHGEDIVAMINDAASGNPKHSHWHFPNDTEEKVEKILDELLEKETPCR